VLFETTATVLGGGVPQYPDLGAAIDAGRAGAPMVGDSAIAAVLVNAAGILNGLQAYALGLLSGGGCLRAAAAVLALALLAWPFHWVVCCYVASFLVPRREYARVLAPLVDAPAPPPVPAFRIFGAASLGALVLLVIYPSLVATTDQWLRSRTWVSEQLDRIEVTVERVDDILVREGTLAEIARKGEEIAARRVEQRAALEAELNAGFDRMEANVDAYLDWYYSLPAEYARIGRMLIGDLEGYMAARLTETLGAGDPFAAVEAELGRALQEDAAALEEYRTAVTEILQRNRVETGTDRRDVTVVAEARSDHLMLVPEDGLVPLKARLGVGAAGGVAGALSAAIAAKVVAKMMAKGVLKAGAKTLLKVGGGKLAGSAGGAAAGAAAGAAVGSMVPGIGTAIGAVVGGVVAGLAVAASAEYLMLKLEEAYSRDDHRTDLVAELRRMRAEAIDLLTSTDRPATARP
jgi:hypothetical protein